MRHFPVDTHNADAWRRLLLAGNGSPSLRDCTGASLAGALELFATGVVMRESADLIRQISEVADAGDTLWSAIASEWTRRAEIEPAGDLHGTRQFEFFRIQSVQQKTSLQFSLFLERFARSMRQRGFPTNFANAFTKVVDEMADNVVQHSGLKDGAYTGMAGYHVEGKQAAFAVVDIGRGVLTTLRDSPTWTNLSTARQAIRAIVADGASSRVGQGPGAGFKQLFASLVDHNSLIRLRTDDAALMIAEGLNDREGGEMNSPFLPGLQVSVFCALGQRASETPIFPLDINN